MCPDEPGTSDDRSDSKDVSDNVGHADRQVRSSDEPTESPKLKDGLPFSAWHHPESAEGGANPEPTGDDDHSESVTVESDDGQPDSTTVETDDESAVERRESTANDSFEEDTPRETGVPTHYSSGQYVENLRVPVATATKYFDDIRKSINSLGYGDDSSSAYVSQLHHRVDKVQDRFGSVERRLQEMRDGAAGLDSKDQERHEFHNRSMTSRQQYLNEQSIPPDSESEGHGEMRERMDSLADSVEPASVSTERTESRVASPEVTRRAAMAAVSTVIASGVTKLVFADGEPNEPKLTFGYGGGVLEGAKRVSGDNGGLQQGYGEYGYGGLKNDEKE